MKIAYILYQEAIISNRSNGVRSQAISWASALQNSGHQVDLVNEWDVYDWQSYDAIHIIGGRNYVNLLSGLLRLNKNIYFSPIIDPNPNFNYKKNNILRLFKVKSPLARFYKNTNDIEKTFSCFKKIYVRSEFERDHIKQVYDLPNNKFELVPLSYSETCLPYEPVEKESFCLHISSIYQERKNVVRLINAAKKYGFKLVLAGNKGSDKQFEPITKAIGDAENIEVLGFISEDQKIDLYKRAKVFALPSIQEGVGIVALDAAYYGCEIAITNIPGPKEYYKGQCVEVDPFDIDDIGSNILKLMHDEVRFQPKLSEYIKNSYSPKIIASRLEKSYLV